MNSDIAQFIQAAAAASLLAKMVVDGVKMAVDLPRWGPILLAFIGAQSGEFLLLLTQNAEFNRVTISQAVMIGLLAWGLAIGATELQKKAQQPKEV